MSTITPQTKSSLLQVQGYTNDQISGLDKKRGSAEHAFGSKKEKLFDKRAITPNILTTDSQQLPAQSFR